jgi:hypothetical protein
MPQRRRPSSPIGQEFHADILEPALDGTDGGRIRPLPLHVEAIDHVGGDRGGSLANSLRDQLSKVRAERH